MTPEMLVWIGTNVWDPFENDRQSPERGDAAMVVAAMEVAWFFMLRAKEYADSNGVDQDMVLRGCDLRFSHDGLPAEVGCASEVCLQFRKTKSDQVGFGDSKLLKATGKRHLCPVWRLSNGCGRSFPTASWSTTRRGLGRCSGGALGRCSSGWRSRTSSAGLPEARFMSHSLRIGGATALYQATMDVELVKRMGRWSSSAVHRYLQDGGGVIPQVAERMANLGSKARVM